MSEPIESNPPARSAWRGRWFAIGALSVAGGAFGLITAGGIGQNLVYYWGPTELRAAGDKAYGATIRLGGLVAQGSLKKGAGGSGLEFDVIDRQGSSVHVRSTGVPPQMFRENIGVVVEGTLSRAGHFECNRLMVSHSNEYRAPGDDPRVEVERLMRTTKDLDEGASRP